MSKVVELQFEIKEAGKDCIIIVEKNLKLAITIKRLKRGLKLIFSDGLKERKTYLRERDLEDQQILENLNNRIESNIHLLPNPHLV